MSQIPKHGPPASSTKSRCPAPCKSCQFQNEKCEIGNLQACFLSLLVHLKKSNPFKFQELLAHSTNPHKQAGPNV